MVRKLMLVIDNTRPLENKASANDLFKAYVNWCFALWGIHAR